MNDDSHHVTGEAVPVTRDPNEIAMRVTKEIVDSAGHFIVQIREQDRAHEIRQAEILARARIDRNKRVDRFAWASLALITTLFIFGRESLAIETLKAAGVAAGIGVVYLLGRSARRD